MKLIETLEKNITYSSCVYITDANKSNNSIKEKIIHLDGYQTKYSLFDKFYKNICLF